MPPLPRYGATVGHLARQRADVDDRRRAAIDHPPSGLAPDEKAAWVGVDDVPPLGVGQVDQRLRN
jgi:hypothetical protein